MWIFKWNLLNYPHFLFLSFQICHCHSFFSPWLHYTIYTLHHADYPHINIIVHFLFYIFREYIFSVYSYILYICRIYIEYIYRENIYIYIYILILYIFREYIFSIYSIYSYILYIYRIYIEYIYSLIFYIFGEYIFSIYSYSIFLILYLLTSSFMNWYIHILTYLNPSYSLLLPLDFVICMFFLF